jgi:hypothetical protein
MAALALGACGDTTPGSPTSTAEEAPAGTLNSEVRQVSPAAPDSPAGGSSGHKGMSPVPDSSGGPSSDYTPPKIPNSVPDSNTTDKAKP